MPRRFILRGAVMLCMVVGVAALSVRRDAATGTGPGHTDRSHLVQPESAAASLSSSAQPNRASAGPHTFSSQYDYCYVDEDGRPLVFHRRRLVFFLPEAPYPDDLTFIETRECQ